MPIGIGADKADLDLESADVVRPRTRSTNAVRPLVEGTTAHPLLSAVASLFAQVKWPRRPTARSVSTTGPVIARVRGSLSPRIVRVALRVRLVGVDEDRGVREIRGTRRPSCRR